MNRTSKYVFVGVLVVGAALLMAPAPGTINSTWNSTFEASPLNSDPVSQGDDWLREHADEIRSRMEVEHEFGAGFTGTSGDNGQHRLGSARCFMSNAAPTTLEEGAGPPDYDNTGNTSGTATLSANETTRSPTRVTGLGRCWIDLNGADGVSSTEDDNALWVYTATGFVQVTTGYVSGNAFGRNSRNLVKNGSFEIGTSTSAPDSWSLSATPTIAYAAAGVTEGKGQKIRFTSNAVNEGLTQALVGLKAGHSYFAVARVQATAGDSCSMRTTSATTNIAGTGDSTTATTAVYEDLTGTFVVDASSTTVNLIIESDGTSDICDFDHVGVFELGSASYNAFIPSSSSWTDSVSITGDLTGDQGSAETDVLATTNTYVIESPNCWVDLRANVAASGATGDPDGTFYAIRASVNGGAIATIEEVNPSVLSGTGTIQRNATVQARVEYPVPGDTYAFNLSVIDTDSSAGTDITTTSTGSLFVTMNCPGD